MANNNQVPEWFDDSTEEKRLESEIRLEMSTVDGALGELLYLLEQSDNEVYEGLIWRIGTMQYEITDIQQELKYI